MKKEIRTCQNCNAKMVEYPHVLNRNLIQCLFVMAEYGGEVAIKTLGTRVSYNQRANFQKLRYWDLVEMVVDEDGVRDGGVWRLTDYGLAFIEGRAAVHKKVWTYRKHRVRWDGPQLYVTDFEFEMWKNRSDYSAEAQGRFFFE